MNHEYINHTILLDFRLKKNTLNIPLEDRYFVDVLQEKNQLLHLRCYNSFSQKMFLRLIITKKFQR